jgi:hypothetical protein
MGKGFSQRRGAGEDSSALDAEVSALAQGIEIHRLTAPNRADERSKITPAVLSI